MTNEVINESEDARSMRESIAEMELEVALMATLKFATVKESGTIASSQRSARRLGGYAHAAW